MNYMHDLEDQKTNVSDNFSLQFEKEVLLQRRKELKLTQKQVADRAGIQLRQYQRFEMGERDILSSSARIMLSICGVLNIDPYMFMGKENADINKTSLILPPIEKMGLEYAIPQYAYFLLISAIPQGMLCTDDSVMACLREAYGSNTLEIKPNKNSFSLYLENSFPYWRVVSQRGYLINSIYSSKERQKEMLEREGLKIIAGDGLRIENYKSYIYDLSKLQITVMKSDEQIAEQFGIEML